jgi:hypothetical protein
MPIASNRSNIFVPINRKSVKFSIQDLSSGVGSGSSLNNPTNLKLINKYNNLIQGIEMFKDLFLNHNKTIHLNELVSKLENLLITTKNNLKLELASDLQSEGSDN